MKELYLKDCNQARKLVISDETTELLQEAQDRVVSLGMERKWRPSLEIDLERSDLASGGFQHEPLIVRVSWSNGESDNIHSFLMKRMLGREDRGWIKTDLGHYCFEGWETSIDHQDLTALPHLWFSEKFIQAIVNPTYFSDSEDERVHAWNILEKEHLKQINPLLYKTALGQVQSRANFREKQRNVLFHERMTFLAWMNLMGEKLVPFNPSFHKTALKRLQSAANNYHEDDKEAHFPERLAYLCQDIRDGLRGLGDLQKMCAEARKRDLLYDN